MTKLKRILDKLKALKKTKTKEQKTDKKYLYFFFYFLLFLFLGTNIFFSQNINYLFNGVINFNEKSIIEFLKKIKNEDYFKNQLAYFENIFQKPLKNEVFREENERNEKIKKLEQILEKNPYSKDVLYSLSLLYQQKGDEKKAREYLIKVKQIDPEINIKFLNPDF